MSLAEETHTGKKLVKKIALYDLPSMIGRPLNTTMQCRSPLVQELQRCFRPLTESIKLVAKNYLTLDTTPISPAGKRMS
jgi:hypothetical protein